MTEIVTLRGAPAEYALPATRPSLAEAQAWCRALATSHYENFHVATWFLPKRLRPHFESIYAFSRVADDLGDEVADTATATRLLHEWRTLLLECYEHPQASQHPVFVALAETIRRTTVPLSLFDDLVTAFLQDQTLTHYATLDELELYSRYSANPVGRLVLWASGYRDEERAILSDKICTGLQLANFWQDVVEDSQRGRRYLPAHEMARFGVLDEAIAERRFTPEFKSMMQHLVGYAGSLLIEGRELVGTVDAELAVTLRLFVGGGQAALDGIVRQEYDVLKQRPSVSRLTKARLLLGALADKAGSLLQRPGKGSD